MATMKGAEDMCDKLIAVVIVGILTVCARGDGPVAVDGVAEGFALARNERILGNCAGAIATLDATCASAALTSEQETKARNIRNGVYLAWSARAMNDGDDATAATCITGVRAPLTQSHEAKLAKAKLRHAARVAYRTPTAVALDKALPQFIGNVSLILPANDLAALAGIGATVDNAEEASALAGIQGRVKRDGGPAIKARVGALWRNVPTTAPLLASSSQALFRCMYQALEDGDWATFDALAERAAKQNYLHARYLEIIAAWMRADFARVVELAHEYNTTIAPDPVATSYHRESHLWADVYRYRAERALNRTPDAAATLARIKTQWPESAWSKWVQ